MCRLSFSLSVFRCIRKKFCMLLFSLFLLTFNHKCDILIWLTNSARCIWRDIEAVITRRSWKPFGCKPTGVRIPLPPPRKRIHLTVYPFFVPFGISGLRTIGFGRHLIGLLDGLRSARVSLFIGCGCIPLPPPISQYTLFRMFNLAKSSLLKKALTFNLKLKERRLSLFP